MIRASEARDIAFALKADMKDTLLHRLMTEIKSSILAGEYHCTFWTDGEHLEEQELEYLRDTLGYDITWNSACLWYEVSW